MRWMAFTAMLAMVVAVRASGGPGAEAPSAGAEAVPEALPRVTVDDVKRVVAEAAGRGEVTVVDFWATWCQPCVAMFPGLHAGLVELKERGLPVRAVTVTLDDAGTAFEQNAIKFLAEHDALSDAYIAVPDGAEQERFPKELGERWDNLVVPAILVFGKDGKLVGEFLDGPSEVEAIVRAAEGAASSQSR